MPRVIQVGLGAIGRALCRRVLGQPGFELVGAVDPHPDIAGHDVGKLVGAGPLGTFVDAELGATLDRVLPDLALHATGSHLGAVAGELRELLSRRIAVVSTCEELAYPFYRHPELAADLDAAARAGGVALLGSGVNPGFVMDKLVVTLLAACTTVRSVRVSRIVDAARRRESFQRKIGAGLSPVEFAARREQGLLGHVGLAESAHMLGDVMGLSRRRELEEIVRPVMAERRLASSHLIVEVGQTAGIEQTTIVRDAGVERVRLELHLALGASAPRDAVTIEGAPPIEMVVTSGVPGDEGTAAVVAHSARHLALLAPGLRTMLDVPLRFFPPASGTGE